MTRTLQTANGKGQTANGFAFWKNGNLKIIRLLPFGFGISSHRQEGKKPLTRPATADDDAVADTLSPRKRAA